jgi:O-antigen/teichoic acid export membrane protein
MASFLSNSLNITVPFYLALYIEPSAFGKLAIATIAYGFLNMLFRPAFGEARIQQQDIYSSKNIDDVVFSINLIKMSIVTLILYMSIAWLNKFYNDEFNDLFHILILANCISAFRSPRIYLLAKELNFKKSSILETIPSMLGGIASIGLAIYTKEVISIVYGMLIASLVRTILSQYFIPYRYKISFDFSKLKGIFSFGMWVMVERILSNIGSNIDKILLSILLDLHWLGIYQMAKSIGFKLFGILSQIAKQVLFPVLSKLNHTNTLNNRIINITLYAIVLVGITLVGCIYIFIPYFIDILGNKWVSSLGPGITLSLAGFFSYFNTTLLLGIIKSYGNAKITASAQLYKIVLLTILTLVLGFLYSITGVVSAVVITEVILTIFVLMNLNKHVKIDRKIYILLVVFFVSYLSIVWI